MKFTRTNIERQEKVIVGKEGKRKRECEREKKNEKARRVRVNEREE